MNEYRKLAEKFYTQPRVNLDALAEFLEQHFIPRQVMRLKKDKYSVSYQFGGGAIYTYRATRNIVAVAFYEGIKSAVKTIGLTVKPFEEKPTITADEWAALDRVMDCRCAAVTTYQDGWPRAHSKKPALTSSGWIDANNGFSIWAAFLAPKFESVQREHSIVIRPQTPDPILTPEEIAEIRRARPSATFYAWDENGAFWMYDAEVNVGRRAWSVLYTSDAARYHKFDNRYQGDWTQSIRAIPQ